VLLVVYRLEAGRSWTVFNAKVPRLGREVARRALNPRGGAAMAALRRFRAVLDAVRPAEVFTAATAAGPRGTDGPAFIALREAETGSTIRNRPPAPRRPASRRWGHRGPPQAEGLVGDLGGSSLELSRIGGGRVSPGVTLPLGPFALGRPRAVRRGQGPRGRRPAGGPAGRHLPRGDFHAVGGAWRNLAICRCG
jgi:exopolyphosphatase/guanosine-5'-triphosphate,3'-diphosphate pyrophosphatase